MAYRFRTQISWACAGALALMTGACGEDKGPASTGGLAQGVAVLVSDYTSVAISLVDPATATLTRDACLGATTFTATEVPFSGDVALATSPTPDHELVAIDRKNSVITFASPATCTVRAQLSVGTGGFKSNPQDVLVLSAHKAYVSRYETNLAPDPAQNGLDGGDDILVIDPSVPSVIGRIPLSSYATMSDTGPTQARPTRLLRAGDRVLVGLDSLSATFDQGPGRLVAIDPATDSVTGTLDVTGLKNCGGFAYDGTSRKLVVSCGGSFSAVSQIDESGLAVFGLGSEPSSVTILEASTLGSQPLSFSSVTLLDGNTAYVAALGSLDFATNAVLSRDSFLRVDLGAGTAAALAMSSPFGFGDSLVAGGHVLLADGDPTKPGVRVFAADAVGAEAPMLDPDPAHSLPPRALTFF